MDTNEKSIEAQSESSVPESALIEAQSTSPVPESASIAAQSKSPDRDFALIAAQIALVQEQLALMIAQSAQLQDQLSQRLAKSKPTNAKSRPTATKSNQPAQKSVQPTAAGAFADDCGVSARTFVTMPVNIGARPIAITRYEDDVGGLAASITRYEDDVGVRPINMGTLAATIGRDQCGELPIIFDYGSRSYYGIGKKLGKGWSIGKSLINKG